MCGRSLLRWVPIEPTCWFIHQSIICVAGMIWIKLVFHLKFSIGFHFQLNCSLFNYMSEWLFMFTDLKNIKNDTIYLQGPTNGAGGPQHYYPGGYPHYHVPQHHMQHSPPPIYQKDERTQRAYSKLKQKLERKQHTTRNNGIGKFSKS